jgi:putative sigma-54 modulation protein
LITIDINGVEKPYKQLITEKMPEVFLRIDKSQEGDNKVAEVKILIPGKELFAKKQCKTFEEATDLAVEALRKQVKKHKEKVA